MTTSYTDIFSGNPVQTSPTSYRAFTISSSTTLSWPLTNEDTSNVAADLMEVTASSSSLNLLMPPANEASVGKSCLIRNIGSNTFIVCDNSGNTIQSIAAGEVFWIYISDNSSVDGTWNSFQFGTGTSSADANTLAGAGLYASAATLNIEFEVNAFASNTTLTTGYRATTANWTGGAGTFAFSAVTTLGNGWFCLIKNSGTGALTLNPNAAELIDQASTINLDPLESCIVVCDGTQLLTIGRSSESASPVFTRLVKSVAGSSNVTLTASEAAYDIQEYTGALTGNISVIVPTTVARWWIYNNTTGAYSLTVKTAAGTGIALAQGTRQIMHCDGTNVVLSVDAGSGTVTSIATGTGLSGGPITTSGTISLANTAVAAGTYGAPGNFAGFVVDAQGRLTSATNSSVSTPSAGTSSAPPYSFSGDSNTGIYSSAADTVSFATGGSLRAEFANSGAAQSLYTPSSSSIGIVIQGQASQSANLVDLRNNSGTTQFAIGPSGIVTTGVWNATALTPAYGGTGLTTLTANNLIVGAGTSNVTFIAPGTSGNVLTSNGTTWASTALPASGSLIYLGVFTGSSASSCNITSMLSSTYDDYEIWIDNLACDPAGANVLLRTSTDNGSTWSSSASDYAWANQILTTAPAVSQNGSSGDSSIQLMTSASATGQGGVGIIRLFNVNGSLNKRIIFDITMRDNSSVEVRSSGFGSRLATAAINAVQILLSTSTFSYTIRVYGVKKS